MDITIQKEATITPKFSERTLEIVDAIAWLGGNGLLHTSDLKWVGDKGEVTRFFSDQALKFQRLEGLYMSASIWLGGTAAILSADPQYHSLTPIPIALGLVTFYKALKNRTLRGEVTTVVQLLRTAANKVKPSEQL